MEVNPLQSSSPTLAERSPSQYLLEMSSEDKIRAFLSDWIYLRKDESLSLCDLPIEIQLNLYSFLNFSDLTKLGRTSKAFWVFREVFLNDEAKKKGIIKNCPAKDYKITLDSLCELKKILPERKIIFSWCLIKKGWKTVIDYESTLILMEPSEVAHLLNSVWPYKLKHAEVFVRTLIALKWKNFSIPIKLAGDTGVKMLLSKKWDESTIIATLEVLLKNQLNPDTKIENETLLFRSIRENRVERVALLLTYGAKPAIFYGEKNALHFACEEGNLFIIDLISNAGCDINSSLKAGSPTPLSLTYKQNTTNPLEVAEYLLKRGANPNKTALLIYSIYNKNDEWALCLLHHQANPNLFSKTTGYTALHHAAKFENLKMIDALLTHGARIDNQGSIKKTPLGLALSENPPLFSVSEYLLQKGANPNIEIDGETPLTFATKKGDLGMVNLLLGYGADPEIFSKDRLCPLHWAAELGFIAIIESLMNSKRADVNSHGKDRGTPLAFALFCNETPNRFEVAELLIEYGANINLNYRVIYLNYDDYPLIHTAIAKKKYLELLFLLDKEADPNLRCPPHANALIYAVEKDDLEAIKILANSKRMKGDQSKALFHAIKLKRSLNYIPIFYENFEMDLSATNEKGETLVHFAYSISLGYTKALLRYSGSNLNAKNREGKTLMHRVCLDKNRDFLLELMTHEEADFEVRNRQDMTPFHSCIDKAEWDLVRLLFSLNPNPDTLIKGITPLILAIQRKAPLDIIQSLGEKMSPSYKQVPDPSGKNALIWAHETEQFDVLKLLMKLNFSDDLAGNNSISLEALEELKDFIIL